MSGALKESLAREALALGFDCIGVTAPDAIADAAKHFHDFLASGAHGDMDWLAQNPARRADPRALWPGVRSVIMLGVNYGPDQDPLVILAQRTRGAISVYAQGDDYHDLIKKRLKLLARWLVATAPCEVKVFVDTAAVMEKPLAQAAGLGWQGKHTNLVSRGRSDAVKIAPRNSHEPNSRETRLVCLPCQPNPAACANGFSMTAAVSTNTLTSLPDVATSHRASAFNRFLITS